MSRLTPTAPFTLARAAALSGLLPCTVLGAARAQDTSLVGLWYAKRYFGPEVRGELLLQRTGDRWQDRSARAPPKSAWPAIRCLSTCPLFVSTTELIPQQILPAIER